MSKLFLKADHIIETARTDAKRHSYIFLHPLEDRDGYVFCVTTIDTALGTAKPALALLEERVRLLAKSFGQSANAQHRFEQFLSSLNERIAQSVEDGAWRIPVKSFHSVVGVTTQGEMYISGTGDLTVLFLHNRPEDDRYQVFNLSRSIRTEQAMPDWKKIYAVVLDGDLHAGDVLCVSDRELQREVPTDDLNTALAKLPPTGAVEKLRQHFPDTRPLALLAIKAETEQAPMENERATPLSNQSIDQLENTKTETKETLADKRPSPKQWLKRLFATDSDKSNEGIVRTILGIVLVFIGVAARLLLGLVQRLGALFLVLFKKDTRQKTLTSTERTLKQHTKKAKRRFVNLPSRSKYLLLAALLLFIVFAVGLGVLSKSKARQAEINTYHDQLETVEATVDRAEGAIIYQDEEQARNLYAQARNQLDELGDPLTERQGQQITALRSRITEGVDDMRHITHIETPEQLADLGAFPDGAQPTELIAFGPDLYIFSSNQRVYRLDREQNTLTELATTNGEIGAPVKAASDDNRVVFIDTRPGVSLFNPTEQQLQVTDLAPGANTSWQDLDLYASSLYMLETDEGDGRILQFNATGDGYGSPSGWIQSKTTSLEDAISITIDGSIYVLKSSGDVRQYFRGIEQSWSQGIIDPPLERPSHIWTDADTDFLYILDPESNRLVVLDKESGSLVVQYTSGAWSRMQDVIVNESLKLAYILTPEGVYKIDLTHL